MRFVTKQDYKSLYLSIKGSVSSKDGRLLYIQLTDCQVWIFNVYLLIFWHKVGQLVLFFDFPSFKFQRTLNLRKNVLHLSKNTSNQKWMGPKTEP